MSDLTKANGETAYDSMTPAEFEERLPELFATGNGKVSEDPRFTKFLRDNPDCAALVRDLETIAETAKSLFEPVHEPSEDLWGKIASKLREEPIDPANELAE